CTCSPSPLVGARGRLPAGLLAGWMGVVARLGGRLCPDPASGQVGRSIGGDDRGPGGEQARAPRGILTWADGGMWPNQVACCQGVILEAQFGSKGVRFLSTP